MRRKLSGGLILLLGLTLASCFEPDNNVDPNVQLQDDVVQIDNYLALNPPDSEDIIIRDASGLRMVITEMGSGEIPPTLENIIQVSYVGRVLSNGEINPTPFDQDDSFTLTLTTTDVGPDVISGWKLALRMMTQGTKARVYIPSSLAYGRSGSGSIPGNTILVFDMELKVVYTKLQEVKLADEIVIITRYVAENDIENTQLHPSGVRYVIHDAGTGPSPGLYDQVAVRYTGKLMNEDEDVFEDNVTLRPTETFSSRAVNYIHGLTYGLQLLGAGGRATFYIPSTLGYGPTTGITDIPANSNLILEVELLEVTPNPE